MPLLNTQTKLRAARNLPFCYLCGLPFSPGDLTDRDHVPPQTIFAPADRNPLTLRAHRSCNSSQSSTDERSGQLLGLKLGRAPREEHRRLNLRHARTGDPGISLGVLQDFAVDVAIRRWLRGFHAALYQVPMPMDSRFSIQTPFPSARIDGGKFVVNELPHQHFVFVNTIKRNRFARNLDGIHCNNGKLRYECAWEQSDDGKYWLCIFALDVYGWIDLGDVNNFHPRGCAGMYASPSGSVPKDATKGTRLEFNVQNRSATDPFSD